MADNDANIDMRVQVDVTGALAKLSAVAKGTTDLTPVLEGPINQSIDQFFKRRFDSEGTFGGTRWKSLAPATIELRKRRGHGRGGIGRDTNELWASLTKLGLGPNAIKAVTPSSIERGTSLRYAQWFSQGYVSKTFAVMNKQRQAVFLRRRFPKRIAGRPIIPDTLPNELVRSWERFIAAFVQKKGA